MKLLRFSLVTLFGYVLSAGLFQLNCVVPSDTQRGVFRFNHSDALDTVAPFGSITIVFTEPVADSSLVDFLFSPPFYSYTFKFNTVKDSVTIVLSEPLKGNTNYSIHLQDTIYSINNALFTPQSDSVVVMTSFIEQEPNDRLGIADTLPQRCFGTVTVVNDTDWYVVTEKVESIFLQSFGSQTTFSLAGAGDYNPIREFNRFDTVFIPDTTALPLYIVVYSYFKSVGGYYKIGYVAADR